MSKDKVEIPLPPLKVSGDYYEAILAQLREREEQLRDALAALARLKQIIEDGRIDTKGFDEETLAWFASRAKERS